MHWSHDLHAARRLGVTLLCKRIMRKIGLMIKRLPIQILADFRTDVPSGQVVRRYLVNQVTAAVDLLLVINFQADITLLKVYTYYGLAAIAKIIIEYSMVIIGISAVFTTLIIFSICKFAFVVINNTQPALGQRDYGLNPLSL